MQTLNKNIAYTLHPSSLKRFQFKITKKVINFKQLGSYKKMIKKFELFSLSEDVI